MQLSFASDCQHKEVAGHKKEPLRRFSWTVTIATSQHSILISRWLRLGTGFAKLQAIPWVRRKIRRASSLDLQS